jgi:hypothetical protein
MRSNALRRENGKEMQEGMDHKKPPSRETPLNPIQPRSTRQFTTGQQPQQPALRMYTEEEVSEMLQISLSQLRKWRMKENQDNGQGPPFKKIGRLVRYPESGLLAYINGQESDY